MITAEDSSVIERPIEQVFAFLSEPANEPKWHTDVIEASLLAPPMHANSEVRMKFKFMGVREATMEVADYEPNQRIRLETKVGVMKGLKPTLTYLVEPASGGTRFTRRLEVKPEGLASLMTPMMKVMVKKNNAQFVMNLKKFLEISSSKTSG
ncbi:MAG: SRPBCC family protein [Acidimicrobiia bacterium]